MLEDHMPCTTWGLCHVLLEGVRGTRFTGKGLGLDSYSSAQCNKFRCIDFIYLFTNWQCCPMSSEHPCQQDNYVERLFQRNSIFGITPVTQAHMDFKRMAELKPLLLWRPLHEPHHRGSQWLPGTCCPVGTVMKANMLPSFKLTRQCGGECSSNSLSLKKSLLVHKDII